MYAVHFFSKETANRTRGMGETQTEEGVLVGQREQLCHARFVRLPPSPFPAEVTLAVKDMGSETRFGPYHYSVFRPHCHK